jgi:predicted DNA-binding protein (MmcQ/YjbR family)
MVERCSLTLMATKDEAIACCEALPGAVLDYPFGPGARVYKVMGKMFALLSEQGPPSVSLKCDPVWAEALRHSYPEIKPGYHLAKRHWNTVTLDGSLSVEQVADMIHHSYELVVNGLRRAEREQLARLTAT